MIQPAKIDIRVDRDVPLVRTFAFCDFDFTGAALKMEVRRYPGEPGTALLSLTGQSTDVQGLRIIYAGSDTVQNHILAGRLSAAPPSADGGTLDLSTIIQLTQIRIRVDKANVVALPSPQEVSDDLDLVYDLHITPVGGDEDVYASGLFTIVAGVTQ